MGLITVKFFLACLICLHAVWANELVEIDYSSDDTVVVDALNEEIESTTVLSDDDDVNSTPLPVTERLPRQENEGEGEYCVTNTGLSGTCTRVKDCFPRLFPVNDNSDNDTPMHTGVYNQNLLKLLLEASGFCQGPSSSSSRNGALSRFRTETVCCATNNVSQEFSLDDDTTTVDTAEFARRTCGKLKIDPKILPSVGKIVGGRKAVLGEFPWMVAMLRRGQQFCGASLIDNKNVLTAAHCVEFMTKNDVANLRLNIGDLDIYSKNDTQHVQRRAKRVLYHKGFTMKNLAHDIAIIHLDKPVEFSKTIQPVCLHPGNPAYDTGKEEADVAGWGTTSSGGSQSSTLLAVRINVITQDECNQKYAKAGKKVGPGMVCAGSKGKDSCQGDSGGPLVMDSREQGKQIGIVSWGIGCASYPGVYTRVDKYMKWINKNKQ